VQIEFDSRAGHCKVLAHNRTPGEIGVEYRDAGGKWVMALPHDVAKELALALVELLTRDAVQSNL
jgi:hypothetical protein